MKYRCQETCICLLKSRNSIVTTKLGPSQTNSLILAAHVQRLWQGCDGCSKAVQKMQCIYFSHATHITMITLVSKDSQTKMSIVYGNDELVELFFFGGGRGVGGER